MLYSSFDVQKPGKPPDTLKQSLQDQFPLVFFFQLSIKRRKVVLEMSLSIDNRTTLRSSLACSHNLAREMLRSSPLLRYLSRFADDSETPRKLRHLPERCLTESLQDYARSVGTSITGRKRQFESRTLRSRRRSSK